MSLFRNETIVTPNIVGVQDGSSAKTGSVGEVIFSLIHTGSGVSLSTATVTNVTSISLTPGSWLLSGNVNFNAAGATVVSGGVWAASFSTTSATLAVNGIEAQAFPGVLTTTSFRIGVDLAATPINLTTTTTVYLVGEASFTAGTVAGYGALLAIRVR